VGPEAERLDDQRWVPAVEDGHGRQERGRIGLGRGRNWGGAVSARATRREPGTEAIEPIAERVDGDAAELAELDVGQSRAAEIREIADQ